MVRTRAGPGRIPRETHDFAQGSRSAPDSPRPILALTMDGPPLPPLPHGPSHGATATDSSGLRRRPRPQVLQRKHQPAAAGGVCLPVPEKLDAPAGFGLLRHTRPRPRALQPPERRPREPHAALRAGMKPPSLVNNPPSLVNNPPSLVNNPPSLVNNPPSLVNNPPSLVNIPPPL